MPSEESTILCASRKWPAAARPTNRCAYRVVASFVADVVMSLLRAMAPVPALDFLPVPFRLVQANANRLEESYDKASLFRERKSRLRAGCCKTSGRAARDPRRDRRLSRLQLIPDNHEKFVPRSAAGWRFPQSVEKTARPSGRRARRKLRWFVLPPHAEQSRRTNFERAAALHKKVQNFVELLHFFVQRRGALKIQFLAGLFALLLESSSQGPAAGLKEL